MSVRIIVHIMGQRGDLWTETSTGMGVLMYQKNLQTNIFKNRTVRILISRTLFSWEKWYLFYWWFFVSKPMMKVWLSSSCFHIQVSLAFDWHPHHDLKYQLLSANFPPASWIKVIGMLPNDPPHDPELSQSVSLKKTHLVWYNMGIPQSLMPFQFFTLCLTLLMGHLKIYFFAVMGIFN